MEKQLIITISREFGSGGREISKLLSEHFGIGYYDRNLLDEIAKAKNADSERLKKFDEIPKRRFLSRTVRGISNSPEEIIANIQFDYIRQKAESGESFVIVGRCADDVLADYDGIVRLFIVADEEYKIKRISKARKVNDDEARGIMVRHDKNRRAYHDCHCSSKWGHASSYDITINSSCLGIEKTADFLAEYIRLRIEK